MPDAMSTSSASAKLLDLELRQAREASLKTREDLDGLLSDKIGKYASEDTSLVVFGSLAREEWTSKSDLDWTYLIDGGANSDHLRISQEIQKAFKEAEYAEPGPTGIFGNMAFSHDVIHQIGGHTTRTRTRPSESYCCWNPAPSAKEQRLTSVSSGA